MSNTAPEEQEQTRDSSIVVASVLSNDRVVINKGSEDGIRIGRRYLIYELTDEEIIDPVNKESLGYLEVPKGTGTIVSVQDHMSILESDEERRPVPTPSFPKVQDIAEALTPVQRAAIAPFRNPLVGDSVKRLS
jgi:hypothetical protein